MVLTVVVVSGVGVHGPGPQQGVIGERVRWIGGGWGNRGLVGEHGVVIVIKIHGAIWWIIDTKHNDCRKWGGRGLQEIQNLFTNSVSYLFIYKVREREREKKRAYRTSH